MGGVIDVNGDHDPMVPTWAKLLLVTRSRWLSGITACSNRQGCCADGHVRWAPDLRLRSSTVWPMTLIDTFRTLHKQGIFLLPNP